LNAPVGVFDSGVGGLTVLRAQRRLCGVPRPRGALGPSDVPAPPGEPGTISWLATDGAAGYRLASAHF
jgi:hypothetical protein